MKTTSKHRTPKSTEENKPNNFGRYFSGDVLLEMKDARWYLYFIMLFLFAVIIVANERSIKKKNKIIDQKEYEYTNCLNYLKNNNQFISYEQLVYIKEQADKRGLKKKEKSIYKLKNE